VEGGKEEKGGVSSPAEKNAASERGSGDGRRKLTLGYPAARLLPEERRREVCQKEGKDWMRIQSGHYKKKGKEGRHHAFRVRLSRYRAHKKGKEMMQRRKAVH